MRNRTAVQGAESPIPSARAERLLCADSGRLRDRDLIGEFDPNEPFMVGGHAAEAPLRRLVANTFVNGDPLACM
jgi:hypothetical protein